MKGNCEEYFCGSLTKSTDKWTRLLLPDEVWLNLAESSISLTESGLFIQSNRSVFANGRNVFQRFCCVDKRAQRPQLTKILENVDLFSASDSFVAFSTN